MSLTIESHTPQGRAATLLVHLYGPALPELRSESGPELSLITSEGTKLHKFEEIVQRAFGGIKGLFGVEGEQGAKEEVTSWLGRIGGTDLNVLNTALEGRTYLVGNSATIADFSLYAALHPTLVKEDKSTLLSHPSLTRHFDHIQHLPLVLKAVEGKAGFEQVKVDVEDVPEIVRVAEVKVKKVPKEGEANKEVEKKELEVASAAAAAVATEAGVKKEKPKKEKKEGGEGGGKKVPAPVEVLTPAPWMVDLRVGTIIDVKLHPDADTLYVETIDVGEAEPRTVVSGLVKYMTIDQMKGRTLITVCNLKPANMRGVKSFAMVLCASSKEGKEGGIEFVDPPAGSKPGDRVYFEGFESEAALDLLNPKKKIFETVQPGFTTLETKEAAWVSEDKKVHRIMTDKGVCAVATFVGASLS